MNQAHTSKLISYAQNFEDVMLWRALKHIDKGFYIDVGAMDPVKGSVTKLFYDAGWHGVNIEPNKEYYNVLVDQRDRDINIHCAACSQAGSVTLFEVKNDHGLTTMMRDYKDNYRDLGYDIEEQSVSCKTLDEICDTHDIDVVHFLKIDVEGAEKEVLEGFSFKSVRPWIVVIEANAPYSTEDISSQWDYMLLDNSYEPVYYDGLNRYYVAKEHADLASNFEIPPNVLDDFITYHTLYLEEDIKELNIMVEQLKQDIVTVTNAYIDKQKERDNIDRERWKLSVAVEELKPVAERSKQLQLENRAQRHEINAVMQSLSWRITAPLRYGKSRLGFCIRKILAPWYFFRNQLNILVRKLIRIAIRIQARFPVLYKFAHKVINRYPRVKMWIRRREGYVPAYVSSDNGYIMVNTDLTKLPIRAKRIFDQIQRRT